MRRGIMLTSTQLVLAILAVMLLIGGILIATGTVGRLDGTNLLPWLQG